MIMIKINGLRSFAKFSSHDFAVTIAIGSILASTAVSKEPSVIQGALAIGSFLALQALYSKWRLLRSQPYLENSPLFLMKGSEILKDNLKKAKVTEDDLMSKLREANVINLKQVHAVVFEPSGDIAVLHGEGDLDQCIIQDVKR